jgi:ATP-dependent DNA helicase PIF1
MEPSSKQIKTSIILSPCQEAALAKLNQQEQSVFLTGLAGTGKSFLIREFLKDRDFKEYPVVASTGVAALLAGGRTFHSFFGLGILEGPPDKIIDKAARNYTLKKRLKQAKCIIIDEVSMLPALALDCAEAICRKIRNNSSPWGGLRIIALGDFAQLPPVSKNNQMRSWAFLSQAWERTQFDCVTLKSMQRSEDQDFLRVLNFIRAGSVNEEVCDYLNSKIDEDFNNQDKTFLFARRNDVDSFNQSKLNLIDNPLKEFRTSYSGGELAILQLKKIMPIPDVLQLKKNCLVMLRVNDPQYRFVNGSLGIIRDLDSENLTIELKRKNRLVDIKLSTFSLLDAEGEAIATAQNFPVNLAYATTIHKAQGATLDDMVTDLRKLWEPGQAYVALSRLRSGHGLTLVGWDEDSIFCDEQVLKFHQHIGLT